MNRFITQPVRLISWIVVIVVVQASVLAGAPELQTIQPVAAATTAPPGVPIARLADAPGGLHLFDHDNLIAWCIVPFDGKHRGPEERAQMLDRLSIRHFAYDWRGKDIPTFDAELAAARKHHVHFDAIWLYSSRDPAHDTNTLAVLNFIRRNHIRPQVWLLVDANGIDRMDQQTKVDTMSRPVAWIADQAAKLGCVVGLYNHNGWYGEPENQAAIVRKIDRPNVGFVYNLSHGHRQVDRFEQLLKLMMPRLLAVNLTGMNPPDHPMLPIGAGQRDLLMLKQLVASGYRGPIGIIGENLEQYDVGKRLADDLKGLDWLVRQLKGEDAGPPPKYETYTPPKAMSSAYGKPLAAERLANNTDILNQR